MRKGRVRKRFKSWVSFGGLDVGSDGLVISVLVSLHTRGTMLTGNQRHLVQLLQLV